MAETEVENVEHVTAYMSESRGLRLTKELFEASLAKAQSQDRSWASAVRLLLKGYVSGEFRLPG